MFHSLITLTLKLAFVAGLLSHPHPIPPPTTTATIVDTVPASLCCPAGTAGSSHDVAEIGDALSIFLIPQSGNGYQGTMNTPPGAVRHDADTRVLLCSGPAFSAPNGTPSHIPASSLDYTHGQVDVLILSGTCQVEVK